MRKIHMASAFATVALVVGLVVALTSAPIGATRRGAASLSWANGPEGRALELPATVLMPGEVVTRRLVVANTGSDPVVASLSVSSVGDDALARVLDVEIKSGVRVCAEPAAAAMGTIEAAGTAAGTELGPRPLRGSSTLRLCVRVTMRLDADNSVQGKSTVTTLRLVTTRSGSDPTS